VDCYTYAVNTFAGGTMGASHWYYPENSLAEYNRALIGDGLLPSTKTASCPDGRTKVALLTVSASDPGDFHWVRKDTNGNWSQKWVGALPKQTDDSGMIIKDPETAGNMGGRKYVVRGYYCTCSDAAQGQGRTRITAPSDEVYPWPWGPEIPP
jgi:hypothetical protein